ncbi:MAG TPA: PAS domain S-box protein [Candidatus Binatia bacterium]|jgi:PAS domain S-box-containing protein
MSEPERSIELLQQQQLDLATEIEALNRLYRLSAQLLRPTELKPAMELILEGSMEILGAVMGDVQIYDASARTMKILAHRGFEQEYIDRLQQMPLDHDSPCGRAMASGSRVIVEDMESYPSSPCLRTMAAEAGYRGMQCTPLISRDGVLLGIVSTQFQKSHRPSEHELRLLDLYLVHATDTIERIRTVEELRQSEQLYRAIGDSIPYGIWIANAQGHNIYLSDSFCALTGLQQSDWTHSGWMRTLHPDDAEATRISWEECVRTGGVWEREYRVRGVDGEWHPILARGVPVYDGVGTITGWVGIHLDIGNRVRTRELARRQAQMLEETHDAIFQWQFEGGIINWNRGAERLYGFTREEAHGKRPSQLLQSQREGGVQGIKQILQREGVWNGELRHRTKDGNEIVVDSRMVLWRNPDSSPIVIAANRDITDRKAAEDALRESERKLRDQAQQLEQQLIASGRLVSLGQLTASMAHEFNNPLGIIIGFAEDMLTGVESDDPEYRSLQIIHQEAHRCKKIVEDLLDYARPRVAEMAPVRVQAVVDRTLELVENHLYKQKVQVVKEIASDLPRVRADSQQLAQVLVNLYLNAIDAMPNGGELTVGAAFEQDAGAPEIIITVADTGFGMEASTLDKIFQPFYTAKKRRGLGLGLPICERIVKNHGGGITVQSQPGTGTMFEIRLPATSPEP